MEENSKGPKSSRKRVSKLSLGDIDGGANAQAVDEGEDDWVGPTDIPDRPRSAQDLDEVSEILIRVSAVLGRSTMKVGELMKLGRGAVIELDRKVGEPIDVFLNNRL